MPTPSVLYYPSAHSVLGNAGATVLTQLLSNIIGFSMNSTTGAEVLVKTFDSFLAATDENADA